LLACELEDEPARLTTCPAETTKLDHAQGTILLNPHVSDSNQDILHAILKLRTAVAYLGEKEQCAWWSTRFLGATGRRFLEFNYPRSAFAAGVTAAAEAAKAFHDRRIGKGGVSHLFRLPHIIEQRLSAQLLSCSDETLLSIVSSKEAAIRALADLRKESTTAPEGPVRIGNNRMLSSGRVVSKLAALYADAFETGKQTLPYFTAEEA
jgi:hypothetical protein